MGYRSKSDSEYELFTLLVFQTSETPLQTEQVTVDAKIDESLPLELSNGFAPTGYEVFSISVLNRVFFLKL